MGVALPGGYARKEVKEFCPVLDEPEVIGADRSLKEVFAILRRVAPTNGTVLVTGETGTGKELVVRTLHKLSRRSKGPFVPVNCGAIPADLMESELFGYAKGAFTGATGDRMGRFEAADKGTLFLDEIGEMDLALQVKILRALQDREIQRVGGTMPRHVDVRIVAATNRDLEKEVEKGTFREDLFYRLNVIPVHLPPLRERGEDILALAEHCLDRCCESNGTGPLKLSDEVKRMFLAYPWPGNVRELENFMQRLSILADGPYVQPSDLPDKILRTLAAREAVDANAGMSPAATPPAEAVSPAGAGPAAARSEMPRVGEDVQAQPAPSVAAPSATVASTVHARSPLPLVGASERALLFGEPEPAVETAASGEPAIGPGGFVWPTVATLEAMGMSLRDFLAQVEDRLIAEAISQANGVHVKAANRLGIKRTTLVEKLRRKGMQ